MKVGDVDASVRTNVLETVFVVAMFALGAYMALEGLQYGVGAINRMGPGFFPAALGVLLMAFAVLLAPEALRAGTRPISFPMRPLVMIGLGLVAFAGLVVPVGLVPATLVLVFVSAFAEVGMRPRRALLTALGAAIIGYLVFIVGLRLTIDPFWW
ncbi:tripartite tricarboxylate transporter TctB family protein [Amorphus sp. MBR-141]